MLQAQAFTRLPFSTDCGFNTLILAHVLDSLVRVSRRVVRNRFVYNQDIRQQPYYPTKPRKNPPPRWGVLTKKKAGRQVRLQLSPVTSHRQSAHVKQSLRHAVVSASLCRRLNPKPKQRFRIGRVPYSYHSSVSGTFNSLFKVLCIFPSLYLFAIGLRAIFSLSRGTPADLLSTPKLSDSCRP